jgi:hypothetical protein
VKRVELRGCVQGLPGDQHGHDGRLAGTSGELERDAQKVGVYLGVHLSQPVPVCLWCDLGQPDRGFHGLDLAEEQAAAAVCRGPVLQKATGDRGHTGMAVPPPDPNSRAYLVDVVVRLAEAVFILQVQRALYPVAGWGHWHDELAAAAAVRGNAVWDAVVVQHPVAGGFHERTIQNRVVNDDLGHVPNLTQSVAAPQGNR